MATDMSDTSPIGCQRTRPEKPPQTHRSRPGDREPKGGMPSGRHYLFPVMILSISFLASHRWNRSRAWSSNSMPVPAGLLPSDGASRIWRCFAPR